MAWNSYLRENDYDERADFLINYLETRPANFATNKAFRDTLQYMVGGVMIEYAPNSAKGKLSYLSAGAEKILSNNNLTPPLDYDSSYKKPYKGIGLYHEHTIPIKVMVDYIIDSNHITSFTKANKAWVIDFIKKTAGIALVTKGDNKLLSDKKQSNKLGLSSQLPDGVTIDTILNGTANPAARYDAARIAYRNV